MRSPRIVTQQFLWGFRCFSMIEPATDTLGNYSRLFCFCELAHVIKNT